MPFEEKIDLDLHTILQLLQIHQETCSLQTIWRRNISLLGLKGPCTILLHLVKGQIISCQIISNQKSRSGLEITRFLPYDERLSWIFISYPLEQSEAFFTLRPPPLDAPIQPVQLQRTDARSDEAALIPRRLAGDNSDVLATLSRDLKRVLALVDGERSVEKIAFMLSLSPRQIFEGLQCLADRRLIE